MQITRIKLKNLVWLVLLGFLLLPDLYANASLEVPAEIKWVDAHGNDISINTKIRGRLVWKRSSKTRHIPAILLNLEIPTGLELLESSATVVKTTQKMHPLATTKSQQLLFETTSPLVSFRFSRPTGGTDQIVGLIATLKSFTNSTYIHPSCTNAGISVGHPSSKPNFLFAALDCVNSKEETIIFVSTSDDAYLLSSDQKGQTDTIRIQRDQNHRSFTRTLAAIDKATEKETSFLVAYDSSNELLFFLEYRLSQSLLFLSGPLASTNSLNLSLDLKLDTRLSNRLSVIAFLHLDTLSYSPSFAFPAKAGIISFLPAGEWRRPGYSLFAGMLFTKVLANSGLDNHGGFGPTIGVHSLVIKENKLDASAEFGILGSQLSNVSFANPSLKLGVRYQLASSGFWRHWKATASVQHIELPQSLATSVSNINNIQIGLEGVL